MNSDRPIGAREYLTIDGREYHGFSTQPIRGYFENDPDKDTIPCELITWTEDGEFAYIYASFWVDEEMVRAFIADTGCGVVENIKRWQRRLL